MALGVLYLLDFDPDFFVFVVALGEPLVKRSTPVNAQIVAG
jgi:hypothetical protein